MTAIIARTLVSNFCYFSTDKISYHHHNYHHYDNIM